METNTRGRSGRLIARMLAVAIVVTVMASPALVQADPSPMIIDFQGATGGSLTESGSNVSGTAAINDVFGVNTPANANSGSSNVFTVTGGVMTIDTAKELISITGAVPAAGLGPGSTLLLGTLTNATVSNPQPGELMVSAKGVDAINPVLNQFFGLPANALFNLTGFTLAAQASANTFTPFSTDIASAMTPEPVSLLLFGSGLAGLGLLRRRTTSAR